MKPDAWKFQVVDAADSAVVIHEGEAETYEAARVAMFLLGVEVRPAAIHGSIMNYYKGDDRVRLVFTRLSDGFVMRESGTNTESHAKFPAG